MNLIKTFTRILFFTGLFLISNGSCDRNRFEFPYAPINLNISLTILDSEIGPGEHKFMYPTEGVNGLLIARNFSDEYFVFDRTCTYEPDYSCSVVDDSASSFHIMCPCCNSQYFIDPSDENGEAYVTRGPSRYSLIKYNSFIDRGFLTIRN